MPLHLDALILLQRVWGAFAAITASALAVLAAGAGSSFVESGSWGPSERGVVGLLASCALIAAAAAIGAFAAARGLRLRQPSGRFGALLLAVPNLVVAPFGTALGIYTFWVLLNNDARREFGRPLREEGKSVRE